MAKKDYGNSHSRNQDLQRKHADARGRAPGFQDYDYGSHDDWRRRGFDYIDYSRYIVNENPNEPNYGLDEAGNRQRTQEHREERTPDYSGRGPKNYRRSPERIMEDVHDRLANDARLDASGIDIQVNGNEIILSGVAPDRLSKRRAFDIAESIPGVSNVENRIRINRD